MTTGPVEETTAATDVPAPATGPIGTAPAALPSRFMIIWGVALGVLLVLFAATVIALNSTVFAASGFVSAYLQSLERHDISSIMATPGVEADATASDALLRRDALGTLSQVELVDDEDRGAGEHHVTFSYRIDGEKARTTFVVQHTGARFGVFNAWEFVESPLAVVSVVPRNTFEFEVNGVPVVAEDGAGVANDFQVLVPGAYTFDHESLYLEAEETTVPITATHRSEEFVLNVQASSAFEDAVEEELAAYLDRCTDEQVLQPTGCPFGKAITNRIASTPEWTIAEYPSVEILPGQQTGAWNVPATHGVAHLEVDVMSLFDGTVSSLSESVPFSVAYIVTFTADGKPTLTPQ